MSDTTLKGCPVCGGDGKQCEWGGVECQNPNCALHDHHTPVDAWQSFPRPSAELGEVAETISYASDELAMFIDHRVKCIPIEVERIERLSNALKELSARLESIAAPETQNRGPWTTVGELREGAVFETRGGILAHKTEYNTFNKSTQCDCYLLASGESAHFRQKNNEPAREVLIGAAPETQQKVHRWAGSIKRHHCAQCGTPGRRMVRCGADLVFCVNKECGRYDVPFTPQSWVWLAEQKPETQQPQCLDCGLLRTALGQKKRLLESAEARIAELESRLPESVAGVVGELRERFLGAGRDEFLTVEHSWMRDIIDRLSRACVGPAEVFVITRLSDGQVLGVQHVEPGDGCVGCKVTGRSDTGENIREQRFVVGGAQPKQETKGPFFDLCDTCHKGGLCEYQRHGCQACDGYRGPKPIPCKPEYIEAQPKQEGNECEGCSKKGYTIVGLVRQVSAHRGSLDAAIARAESAEADSAKNGKALDAIEGVIAHLLDEGTETASTADRVRLVVGHLEAKLAESAEQLRMRDTGTAEQLARHVAERDELKERVGELEECVRNWAEEYPDCASRLDVNDLPTKGCDCARCKGLRLLADPQPESTEQDGAALITAERKRQVSAEEWSPEHDQGHELGELAINAAALAVHSTDATIDNPHGGPDPWDLVAKHGHDRVRALTIAGALIAAEIDRELGAMAPKQRGQHLAHVAQALREKIGSTEQDDREELPRCPDCGVLPSVGMLADSVPRYTCGCGSFEGKDAWLRHVELRKALQTRCVKCRRFPMVTDGCLWCPKHKGKTYTPAEWLKRNEATRDDETRHARGAGDCSGDDGAVGAGVAHVGSALERAREAMADAIGSNWHYIEAHHKVLASILEHLRKELVRMDRRPTINAVGNQLDLICERLAALEAAQRPPAVDKPADS